MESKIDKVLFVPPSRYTLWLKLHKASANKKSAHAVGESYQTAVSLPVWSIHPRCPEGQHINELSADDRLRAEALLQTALDDYGLTIAECGIERTRPMHATSNDDCRLLTLFTVTVN